MCVLVKERVTPGCLAALTLLVRCMGSVTFPGMAPFHQGWMSPELG